MCIHTFLLNYGDMFSNSDQKSYTFIMCGFSFRWKNPPYRKGQIVFQKNG